MPALHASRASEDDGDDDVISIGSYGNRGSPAAGASMQPPAASSAPAVKAATAARSGDSGDSVIALEDTDQPSSAALSGMGLPEEQESLKVRCCASQEKVALTALLSRMAICRVESLNVQVACCAGSLMMRIVQVALEPSFGSMDYP